MSFWTSINPWGEVRRLRTELAEAKKHNGRLTTIATDRRYMIEALVEMLGPTGLKVWEMWQAKGARRVHTSWGPAAATMTGEERAQVHLDVEAAPKELVHSIDEDR